MRNFITVFVGVTMWASFSSESHDLVVLPRKQMMNTAQYIQALDNNVIPSMMGYELSHLLVGIGELSFSRTVIGQFSPVDVFFNSFFFYNSSSRRTKPHVIRVEPARNFLKIMEFSP